MQAIHSNVRMKRSKNEITSTIFSNTLNVQSFCLSFIYIAQQTGILVLCNSVSGLSMSAYEISISYILMDAQSFVVFFFFFCIHKRQVTETELSFISLKLNYCSTSLVLKWRRMAIFGQKDNLVNQHWNKFSKESILFDLFFSSQFPPLKLAALWKKWSKVLPMT